MSERQKRCEQCGTRYWPYHLKSQRFCSRTCTDQWWQRRSNRRLRARRGPENDEAGEPMT